MLELMLEKVIKPHDMEEMRSVTLWIALLLALWLKLCSSSQDLELHLKCFHIPSIPVNKLIGQPAGWSNIVTPPPHLRQLVPRAMVTSDFVTNINTIILNHFACHRSLEVSWRPQCMQQLIQYTIKFAISSLILIFGSYWNIVMHLFPYDYSGNFQ